jgi:hypothetical protein
MHQVQLELTDQLYNQVMRRAAESGFESIEEYAVGVITDDLADDTENLDHIFTPERLAHIDKAIAQVKAAEFMTSDQVRAHFRKRFEE